MKRKNELLEDEIACKKNRLSLDDMAQVQTSLQQLSKMTGTEMEVETSEETQIKIPQERVVKCTVHWGKRQFDVEVDLSEPFFNFKAQLLSLTGVDPMRQKIVYRGNLIKNSMWDKVKISDGSQIRMIGTNEVIVIPDIVEPDKGHPGIAAKVTDRLYPVTALWDQKLWKYLLYQFCPPIYQTNS
uniref:Ubiquitin carboxyl-terminal hydrolase 14 n=1 Tax=Myxobolus squamalis TaxID=59785 RepID=A0A6B2G2J6_MYXSQ